MHEYYPKYIHLRSRLLLVNLPPSYLHHRPTAKLIFQPQGRWVLALLDFEPSPSFHPRRTHAHHPPHIKLPSSPKPFQGAQVSYISGKRAPTLHPHTRRESGSCGFVGHYVVPCADYYPCVRGIRSVVLVGCFVSIRSQDLWNRSGYSDVYGHVCHDPGCFIYFVSSTCIIYVHTSQTFNIEIMFHTMYNCICV